jgi:DNA repair protein RecO (recombination protein O)
MVTKVNGLVMRSIKYGETSLIFDMYTEQYGLASFIVNGARKAKSKLPASLFQLTNWIEIVAYFKDPRSLNRVKEAELILHYTSIPFDLPKSSVALFMTEVTQKTIKENESNQALYNFLFSSYLELDLSKVSIRDFHLVFLLKLTKYLGFAPQNNYSQNLPYFNLISGNFVAVDHPLHTLDRDSSHGMKRYLAHVDGELTIPDVDRDTRQKLLTAILNFYRYHLEKFPEIRTHKILAEVFG